MIILWMLLIYSQYFVSQNLSEKNIIVDVLINNAAIDPKVHQGDGLAETSRLNVS